MGIKNLFYKKPNIDFDSIVSAVLLGKTEIYSTRNRYGLTASSGGIGSVVMPQQELEGTEFTFSVRYIDGSKEIIKCMAGSKECVRLLQIANDPDDTTETENISLVKPKPISQESSVKESLILGRNQLPQGKYLIGRDIAPGNYDFECIYNSGYLKVHEVDAETEQKKEIYSIYLANDSKCDIKKAFNVECRNGQALEIGNNMVVQISKSKLPDIDFRPNPHQIQRLREEQDLDNRFWKLVDTYKQLTLESQKLKEENQRLEEENQRLEEENKSMAAKIKAIEQSGTIASDTASSNSLNGSDFEMSGYIWEEFYAIYYEIPEKVRARRLDFLTTLGDAEEVTEIICDLQGFDEQAADRLLKKAADKKLVFGANMIGDFGAMAEESILEEVIRISENTFREDDMQELFDCGVDSRLIFDSCERRGFGVPKDVLEDLGETEDEGGFEIIVDAINELSKIADDMTK